MSRDYINDPNEDVAWSLRRIDASLDQLVEVLERIAGALERAHPTDEEIERGAARLNELLGITARD